MQGFFPSVPSPASPGGVQGQATTSAGALRKF